MADAHILPSLGSTPVARLTREKVRAWHRGLASAAPRVRAKAGKVATRAVDENDEDARRARRASANRVLTVMKAALNHARTEGKVTCSADAWALVKPFREADAPRVRYLLDDELIRLVNACPKDFRELVMAALYTGARYGELTRMKVSAFDPDARTVHIPKSKSAKARYVFLNDAGAAFFVRQVAGKSTAAFIFDRDLVVMQATNGAPAKTQRGQWGKSHQARFMKEACAAARITPPASFHILRHTYGARLARANTPMAVIADQMGHADTRITERHYAHLAPSYVAETVRAGFGAFGLASEDNVTTLRPDRGNAA